LIIQHHFSPNIQPHDDKTGQKKLERGVIAYFPGAAVSQTSRSNFAKSGDAIDLIPPGISTCCGWSRTTQPRSYSVASERNFGMRPAERSRQQLH
jgi:hypothetical protein